MISKLTQHLLPYITLAVYFNKIIDLDKYGFHWYLFHGVALTTCIPMTWLVPGKASNAKFLSNYRRANNGGLSGFFLQQV